MLLLNTLKKKVILTNIHCLLVFLVFIRYVFLESYILITNILKLMEKKKDWI